MEWKPFDYRPGGNTIVYEEMFVGSSVTGLALTETTMKLAVDFQAVSSNRKLKKYVGVAKSRSKNFVGVRWLSTESADVYSAGITHFMAQIAGVAAEVAIGRLTVTWYMWFKGQRTNT